MSYDQPTDPRTAGLSAKCARFNARCCTAAISIMITFVMLAAIIASVAR